jgi:site-specific recombinase XerD
MRTSQNYLTPDEVIAGLKAAKERFVTDDGSDFLFVSQRGGTLHRSQFFRAFQAIAKSVGFLADKRHPHVLKHSLACHLVAAT